MKLQRLFVALFIFVLSSGIVMAQDDGDLRYIEFDVDEDFYAEVELTIEEDDISVLFNVKSSDSDDYIYLVEIISSDDDELIYSLDGDDGVITFGFEPLTEDADGQLGVFLPPAPDFDIEPGDYIFVFEAEESDISEVSVIVRSADLDSRQALDINLWVLTDELSDKSEQSNYLDAVSEAMNEMLNPHNMEIGTIEFFVADDSDYDDYAYPEIDDEDISSLQEICSEMSEEIAVSRVLNVAIIEGFDESGEGGTAGIAISAGNAGIIMEESPFSCVVVSYEAYGDDFVSQAANILHEGAHFLSLPHTTESEGDIFDIFDDTPECEADDFDENDDDYVDDFECGVEGGANNFMFWSGDEEFAPFIISESQAWVLKRHPLFYSSDD